MPSPVRGRAQAGDRRKSYHDMTLGRSAGAGAGAIRPLGMRRLFPTDNMVCHLR